VAKSIREDANRSGIRRGAHPLVASYAAKTVRRRLSKIYCPVAVRVARCCFMVLKEANAAPRHRKEVTIVGMLSTVACQACSSPTFEAPYQVLKGIINIAIADSNFLNILNFLSPLTAG
jgi:hypothetical protein